MTLLVASARSSERVGAVALDLALSHGPDGADLAGSERAVGDLLTQRSGGHSEECRRLGEGEHLAAHVGSPLGLPRLLGRRINEGCVISHAQIDGSD